MSITNIMTIDVEDYFQVENFKHVIRFADWYKYELRVEENTEKVLGLLAEADARATFFVLGWIAERCPKLIKKIDEAGHEIACHGYAHDLIYTLSREMFRKDVVQSKEILENIVQKPVVGYRAPSYSLTKDTLWALDVLREEGFQYDSSVYPLQRSRGGIEDAKRFPHKISAGLWEVPISTNRVGRKNISFAGGGYFRLFPLFLTEWSIRSINREGQPANLYLHPWEFDPQQPRVKAGRANEFKHYVNIRWTGKKFRKLLKHFRFQTIRDYLSDVQ